MQKDKIGQEVEAFGWIDKIRNLGGLVFIDLCDRSAVLQIIIDPKDLPDASELLPGRMIVLRVCGPKKFSLPSINIKCHLLAVIIA